MTRPPVRLHSRVVLNPPAEPRRPAYQPANGFLLDTPVGRLPNAPGRAYSTRSRMRGPNRNG